MEYLKFSLLTEKDFDEIIINAGGKRYTDDPKIQVKNCDYIFDDTVIELKIIEEEPIDKKVKQEKLAKLFSQTSKAKTIVLEPSEDLQYEYYKILVSPIQKALRGASKQLKYSANEVNANTKIAIIMNNGLTMTSYKEFKELAIQRAKNNTSGIDILIVCGIYYFSDKFDMNVMAYCDDILIRGSSNDIIIEKIRSSWNIQVEKYMTKQLSDLNIKREKEPIQDLFFEYEGIRYVKPPIQWGKISKFYGQNGRPREDSSNIEEILPLVTVIPIFSDESYNYLTKNVLQKNSLQNSLIEYLEEMTLRTKHLEDKIHAIVPIHVSVEEIEEYEIPFSLNLIQELANEKYEYFLNIIDNEAEKISDEHSCKNFIFLEVQEIGIDKANDVAFISRITYNEFDEINQEWIIFGERLSYEYAFTLASSYCIALQAEQVHYYRNEDFKWK